MRTISTTYSLVLSNYFLIQEILMKVEKNPEICAERDEKILEINNKKTCSPKGMKMRLLFRGMTSSVRLRSANQERSDKSTESSQFWWGAGDALALKMSSSSWSLQEKPFFFGG